MSFVARDRPRLRPRFVVGGAVLFAVVATWALGGFERSPHLRAAPAPPGPIDAGEYSIRFEGARVRPATKEEAGAYLDQGGPAVVETLVVDLQLRNESEQDGIDLDDALQWRVDGEPLDRYADHLRVETNRRDLPGRFGQPRDIWVPMRATYPVAAGEAPTTVVVLGVHAVEYHELGEAFANIIGFRQRKRLATVELPVTPRSPAGATR